MSIPDDEIRQEDTWDVIRKYFDENGLVQQQRASYEEFIIQNIQEVVDDYKGQIEVVATNQYLPGQQNKGRIKLQVHAFVEWRNWIEEPICVSCRLQIEFERIKITRPKIAEVDGKKDKLLPYMARLRKTTYACTIFVNIKCVSCTDTNILRYHAIEEHTMNNFLQ
jgi:DNA-directed RNA polymerase II subunit RPB2